MLSECHTCALSPAASFSPVVRFTIILLVVSLVLSTLWLSDAHGSRHRWNNASLRPPTHEKLWKWEASLPQHDPDLAFPEGRTGRYVKFSNQALRLGWNNCFNEVLMNSHLAYMSEPCLCACNCMVFQPYYWGGHYPWPSSQRADYFRTTTPLNALLSGPAAGRPWEAGDNAPRAVSESYFDMICPDSERRKISTAQVKPRLRHSEGIVVFQEWMKVLSEAPERCVEVVPGPWAEDDHPQVFDLWLFGSRRIVSLWEEFAQSPTSRLLGPSKIVEAAVARNRRLFLPPRGSSRRDPFPRMLAMHLRRGDYREACLEFARYGSTFYSWNLLPFLPDQFTPLPEGHPDRVARVMEHCLPDRDAVVRKVKQAKAEYLQTREHPAAKVDILFILTNEHDAWLEELKDALLREDRWRIVTSRELQLDAEQTEVSMAVDMEIARRAAVFIGNGWSSMTSNIIHARLVNGLHPHINNRFF
ncbi:hypothetical protein FB45DRAFT_1017688 [Roridomyces roridus]|uniref:Uncharacterized protein n=1 Tax=Roridomyces roridus TaxID=1738132 RepID=A0AAD7CJ30_9AGAR|nr:hypothetical protein FB45DRAFT_1017688 [Roridomyces roridus]